MTDNVCCLVKITEKGEMIIAADNDIPTIYRPYTVNYRNALDRLRVHMNIILLLVT